jgi:hypothetical protein
MYPNIFLVGSWTIASRLTGFLRDMALAALMGGGALNDAYVAAIKLPNQFRQIFGEGSFNSAFAPAAANVCAFLGFAAFFPKASPGARKGLIIRPTGRKRFGEGGPHAWVGGPTHGSARPR